MRLFFGFFVLACLLICSQTTAAAEQLMLHVEVSSGFALQLPESFSLPTAAPGETVQGDLEIQIRSNTDWTLEVSSQQWLDGDTGSTVDLESILQVRNADSEWIPPSSLAPEVVASGPATGSEWFQPAVEFRFTGSYADSPGSYCMELEFAVIPQL